MGEGEGTVKRVYVCVCVNIYDMCVHTSGIYGMCTCVGCIIMHDIHLGTGIDGNPPNC